MFLFLGEFPTFFSTACCSMSSSAPLSACWFESPPSPIMMSNFVSSRKYEIHAYSERKTLVLRKTVSRLQVCVLCWTAKAAGLKFPHYQPTIHPYQPNQQGANNQNCLPLPDCLGELRLEGEAFAAPYLAFSTPLSTGSVSYLGGLLFLIKETYFVI